jgi:hypothetical protein
VALVSVCAAWRSGKPLDMGLLIVILVVLVIIALLVFIVRGRR